jgi:hypothetical protein
VTAHTAGLDVTLHLVGDQISETGDAVTMGGQLLSTFASTAEGTIGRRAGAVGMLQLASSNGYLAIEREAVTGATASGSGTVDGVPVTEFDVSVDLDRLALVPGLTPDETKTISDALAVLHQEGYTKTTVRVGIDAAGFIRSVHAVDHFADGGTATYDGTFSNFGPVPGAATSTTPVTPGSPDTTATTSTTATTTAPTTSTAPGGSPATTAPTTTTGRGASAG